MQTLQNEKQIVNKMGSEPVGRIMLKMGIPIILSMMLQAFYNIVDSGFVSNMPIRGEQAMNALTLAFPVQMLMVAISIGTGVGANALLSKSLGQGDFNKAKKVVGNTVLVAGIITIVFMLFGAFGVGAYAGSQTSNAVVYDMVVTYLRICCVVSVGIVYFSMFEKLLQATGHALQSTIAQVSGAVINIIFDPILIYGWFGLPALGVAGAAYATVFGQVVSMTIGLIFHIRYNKEVIGGLNTLHPDRHIIKGIYSIGLPAIIAQALMSIMTYGMNIILGGISEQAVTAYGLYYKIQQFLLFAAFGLRDAITPIVSYNYGMGSRRRTKAGVKCGIVFTLIIMLFGTAMLEIFAVNIASMFGLSGATRDLCVGAIRIISLSLPFAGLNVAYQGAFQALDGGVESLITSVFRQFLFVLPVAWGFAFIVRSVGASITLVWSTFIIAEVLSAVIASIFMKRINKKVISALPDSPELTEYESQKLF